VSPHQVISSSDTPNTFELVARKLIKFRAKRYTTNSEAGPRLFILAQMHALHAQHLSTLNMAEGL
jgi:hypothetical protein